MVDSKTQEIGPQPLLCTGVISFF